MGFTNSPLVNYTRLASSNNHYGARNHAIDTITIHCVVGQCTVEGLGAVFAPAYRGACSNYGIGYDGRIGMYCEEKNASGCSSNKANDERAVTIEVASDTFAPYAVTAKAYNALIELCADICKRNGIKQLLWKGDKSLIGQVGKQDMTAHKWFAATGCPGDYLYSRFGDIVAKVNQKIAPAVKPSTPSTKPVSTSFQKGDKVTVKADAVVYGTTKKFSPWVYGTTYVVSGVSDNGKRVAFSTTSGVTVGATDAKYLTKVSSASQTPAQSATLSGGNRIKIKSGAPIYGTTKMFSPWVYTTTYVVRDITDNGNRVSFQTPDGIVVGAVDKKYVIKV